MKNIYLYDDFKELMSLIGYLLEKKIKPQNIEKEEKRENNFFDEYIHLNTKEYEDTWNDQIEPNIMQMIYYSYLSEYAYKELAIYYFLLNYQKYGPKVVYLRNLNCVNKVENLAHYVSRETHKLKGFLRFKEMKNKFLYAEINPENDVLELLSIHFRKRLKKENWIIKDVARQKYVLYNQKEMHLLTAKDIVKLNLDLSEEENAWEELWKTFFKTIGIKERENKKCQRNFMPKKYWQYIIEMEEEVK